MADQAPIPTRATFKDLTGQVFERLTIVSYAGKRGRHAYWNTRCACGFEKAIAGKHLISGRTKSCGCFNIERQRAHFEKHGHAAFDKSKRHPLYGTWSSMKKRCSNPAAWQYPHYGGRGISVCERWRDDFTAFLSDVGEKPSPQHSLDRIDNNGNYEPGNVRWATQCEQRRNRRK